MATAASYDVRPLRHSSSYELLPPSMSELRVVLLGNSWSLRSLVGNFILGTTEFKTYEDAKWCQRENRRIKEKKVVVINTPDQMLDPNISEVNLIEIIKKCEGLCDPGPHVFLLVLQPKDFTEEDNWRLCRVLERFSDQSFKHSLILMSASREESPGFRERPPLKDLIRKCRSRCLWQKNLELSVLITCFDQIVKENNGEHVSYERYPDPVSSSAADQRSPKQKQLQSLFIGAGTSAGFRPFKTTSGLFSSPWKTPFTQEDLHPLRRRRRNEWLPPDMSELRVVLLGSSWSLRSLVGNFILKTTEFKTDEDPKWCWRENGRIKEKEVVVINTPDQMLDPNISAGKLLEIIEYCEGLCDPGPHVFLLVLQPEDFTEEDNQRLCRVLESFSDQSFDHSLILLSASREESPGFMVHPPLNNFIRKCRSRCLWKKNLELSELLTRFGQIMKENNGEHVSYERYSDPVSSSAADQRRQKQKETQTSFIRPWSSAGSRPFKTTSGYWPLPQKTPFTEVYGLRKRVGKSEVNKQQEERRKEEWIREEGNRRREQEKERKQQEWEQRLEAMEQRIKSESESTMCINKELQKTREEMEKEKVNWAKQQEELEEQRKREDEQRRKEEQEKLRKLQEEYEQKREEDEKKRQEEELIRREEEEKKLKELEQSYETTLVAVKKKHEEEARKQAEEFNEFKEKHNKEFAAEREKHEKELKYKDDKFDLLKALSDHKELELRRKHQQEICTLVKHVTRNKQSLSKIQELLNKHETEMMEKEKKGMNEEEKKSLEKKHEEELMKEIPEILKQVDTSKCSPR